MESETNFGEKWCNKKVSCVRTFPRNDIERDLMPKGIDRLLDAILVLCGKCMVLHPVPLAVSHKGLSPLARFRYCLNLRRND